MSRIIKAEAGADTTPVPPGQSIGVYGKGNVYGSDNNIHDTQAMPLIYQQIPKVMADIRAVGKDQQNKDQGYKFRGIEDLYNVANPAMAKHINKAIREISLNFIQSSIGVFNIKNNQN